MLINLSNHPSANWSKEQQQAAQVYGTITDMPFPAIAPTFNSNVIKDLAEHFFIKVMSEFATHSDKPSAVHVMGEMTFAFTLIALLQKKDITCLASTTERQVEEQQGKKLVSFNFVKFRTYPKMF